ncbi:MAG: 50S ribosomal protein L29 [Cyclobacteriaceae bacterium]
MNNTEIKSLTVEALESAIKEQSGELTKLKFAHAISPIENPNQIKTVKKTIARLKTELTSKAK